MKIFKVMSDSSEYKCILSADIKSIWANRGKCDFFILSYLHTLLSAGYHRLRFNIVIHYSSYNFCRLYLVYLPALFLSPSVGSGNLKKNFPINVAERTETE